MKLILFIILSKLILLMLKFYMLSVCVFAYACVVPFYLYVVYQLVMLSFRLQYLITRINNVVRYDYYHYYHKILRTRKKGRVYE